MNFHQQIELHTPKAATFVYYILGSNSTRFFVCYREYDKICLLGYQPTCCCGRKCPSLVFSECNSSALWYSQVNHKEIPFSCQWYLYQWWVLWWDEYHFIVILPLKTCNWVLFLNKLSLGFWIEALLLMFTLFPWISVHALINTLSLSQFSSHSFRP